MRDALAADAPALRAETAKDIRELFDQSIERAETDSEIVGHCVECPAKRLLEQRR